MDFFQHNTVLEYLYYYQKTGSVTFEFFNNFINMGGENILEKFLIKVLLLELFIENFRFLKYFV